MTVVRRWRERRRLSVQDAATLLDISEAQYETLETCERISTRTPGIQSLLSTAGITLEAIQREGKSHAKHRA